MLLSIPEYSYPNPDYFGIFWTLATGGFSVAILCRVTKAYLRHLLSKPGTCEVCAYNLAHLTEPRCPECGTAFNPEELPGDLAWNATPDWTPPDTSGISEVDFPIDCDACGYKLTGLGNEEECPGCGAEFRRTQRLLELYGPEAFLPGAIARESPPTEAHGFAGALALTAVAVFAVPFYYKLSAGGSLPPDRWPFLMLLFVAAAVAWLRVFRSGST
ncbi:MAG: hypothetical protein JSU86_17630 [Phycisphaerales bacterium]|nr:MAG: hypothetical protein JSU86_17630 [Phycisphaerales bacterium]